MLSPGFRRLHPPGAIGGEPRLIKKNPYRRRIYVPKVMRQSHARRFGECAGHFNPNCSRTHECEDQLAANFLIPGLFDRGHFFRALECTQYFAADDVGNHRVAGRDLSRIFFMKISAVPGRRESVCYNLGSPCRTAAVSRMRLALTELNVPVLADALNNPVFFASTGYFTGPLSGVETSTGGAS